MAQLYFKYGAMNSGKSIEILKVKYNYEEQGKRCVLMTSALDTRSGEGKVTSRIGLSEEAIAINDETNIPKEIGMDYLKKGLISCILVDEAQFLGRNQVESLAHIVDTMNTPVMCFGLKNTFQNKLFEGTEALLTFADKIEEIKTICWYCSKKATMNIRLHNGKAVTEGVTVQIGGEESYRAVCRKHYYELTNKIHFVEE